MGIVRYFSRWVADTIYANFCYYMPYYVFFLLRSMPASLMIDYFSLRVISKQFKDTMLSYSKYMRR